MKTKNLFIVAALAALFMGCSLGSSIFPPSIYSPKAVTDFTNDLKKISEKYIIEEIRVSEQDKLSNKFGYVSVYMRDNEGKVFEQFLRYNMGISHDDPKPRTGSVTRRKQEPPAINVDDIISRKDDFEKYVEEAKSQMKELSEDKFKFESVAYMEFEINKNGEFQTKLTVTATEKGQSQRREGGRMVTDYYELKFIVDKDGNVTYKD